MSDWRKAAGVLRGAIPPGETPESMIRRARDGGPSDAERALAVLDRLWARWPEKRVSIALVSDESAVTWIGEGRGALTAYGLTPAAALLALGAKLAEGDDGN